MKLITLSLISILSLVLLNSCGDDDEMPMAQMPNEKICDNAILEGQINNKPFTFLAGRSIDTDEGFSLGIYPTDFTIDDICDFSPSFNENKTWIFGQIKLKDVGRIELGQDCNLTLFDSEDFLNVIGSDGYVEVTVMTDTTIRGFMEIDGGSDTEVCGTFELTRCQ